MKRSSYIFLLASLWTLGPGALDALAGYAVNKTSTTAGTDSGGASSSVLKLDVTSVSNASNDVSFRVSKKDGTAFTTSGTLSIHLNCGTSTCQTVASQSISAGGFSKTFSIYMPTYVTGASGGKNFYGRYYTPSNGFWSYVGPIQVYTPPLSVPGSTSTTSVTTTSARLNWGSVVGANMYRYQATTSSTFNTSADGKTCSNCVVNGTTTSTSVPITGLAFATFYRWRVRAGNSTTAQESPWTSNRTFTTVSAPNQAPSLPTIASSPTSATQGQSVSVTVWRGTDPDGDQVKVECTATSSNRTDASPYVSSWASGGSSTLASFIFQATGVQTIYCASFDVHGAGGAARSRTINVVASSSGQITSPNGTVEGPVTVSASAADANGLNKVSVVFVPGEAPLVLCWDGTADPCSGTSDNWIVPDVDPRDYGVTGSGALVLGLWVRNDNGETEKVDEHAFTWQVPDASGQITSPSGIVEGLVRVTANASDPDGLNKVSVVFVPNGNPLVLCWDGTGSPCSGTSGSWNVPDVDPRDYAVTGSGPLTLGLWVKDDNGVVVKVGERPFTWHEPPSGEITSPSGSVEDLVTVTATARDPDGLKKVSVVFVPGGPPLVLCEDGTATPCTATAWTKTNVDPRDYGVAGAGQVILGLWVRDDGDVTVNVDEHAFTWSPPALLYPDVSEWAQDAAAFVVQRGIVEDPGTHLLRGREPANRAEAATMIYRALGGGKNAADANFATWHGAALVPLFADVADPDAWYFKPATYLGMLAYASDAGGVTPFDQQPCIFRPAQFISRAWVLKALLEAWNRTPLADVAGVPPFDDVAPGHPAAGYVYLARQLGIAEGTDNRYRPDDRTNREDLFVLLHRTLDPSVNPLAPVKPVPTADDFSSRGRCSAIGHRYEQPVLRGVRPPSVDVSATTPQPEDAGLLMDVYASTLEALISDLDPNEYVDARGVSHRASAFCAWAADGGTFVDLDPGSPEPFCRVKWLAPVDFMEGSAFTVTLYVGDSLGSEVRRTVTLALPGASPDTTAPSVTMAPLPSGLVGGELMEVTGTVTDAVDAAAADFGVLSVELSYSLDGGASWIELGPAELLGGHAWRLRWLLPRLSGGVTVRAVATNLLGNRDETIRTTTVGTLLSIEGTVVDSYGQPVENARAALTGGGLDAEVLADNLGGFRFTSLGGGLVTGTSYTLAASFDGRTATRSGLVLSASAPALFPVLTLDTAPPLTAATPGGGEYSSPQSVELACSDDRSGCLATHFSTDGSPPTTSSPVYGGPIDVSDTTLRFFSVDQSGNAEPERSEVYTLAAEPVRVDGRITDAAGVPIEGVRMDGMPVVHWTDVNGEYGRGVGESWSGTVSPFKPGYTFAPPSRSYSNLTESRLGEDYQGTQQQLTISGRVISGVSGLEGVVLQGLPGPPVTAADGTYSAQVPFLFTGRVTPVKAFYVFTPPHLDYEDLGGFRDEQDYTAAVETVTLSGRVTQGSAGLSGVWLSGLPGGVTTLADGTYSASVPRGWEGTVTPQKTGYQFNPAGRDYTNVQGGEPGDYAASPLPAGSHRLFPVDDDTEMTEAMILNEPGDMIVVEPGTYLKAEASRLEPRVTLLSTGGADVTILRRNGDQRFTQDDVTVDGFTFETTATVEPVEVFGDRVRIRNSRFKPLAGEFSLRMTSASDTLVEGNVFDQEHGIALIAGTATGETVIRNNELRNVGKAIDGDSNPDLRLRVENNLFENVADAVDLRFLRQVTIQNNVFAEVSSRGIDLDDVAQQSSLAHNVFYMNGEAISACNVSILVYDSIFQANTKSVDGCSGGTVNVHHDLIWTGTWLWAGPTYIIDPPTIWRDVYDPRFVNPAAGDFHLGPSSEARGLGTGGSDLGAYGGALGDAWKMVPGTPQAPPAFLAIRVEGQRELNAGDTVVLQALGDFAEGFYAVLTTKATWTSSNEGVLRSLGNGGFTGVAPGTATVTASWGGLSLQVDVTVLGAALVLSVADAPDPALTGGRLEYTLFWRNDGPGTARGARLTAAYDARTSNPSPSTPPDAGTSGTWTLGDLPPAAAGTMTIGVDVDGGLLEGDVLSFAATLETAFVGSLPAAATTSVEVEPEEDLPPTVTRVDTVLGTGDGELDSCESAQVAITEVRITFSEALQDPPGDSDPDDVTHPDNYSLLRAGADQDFATDLCGTLFGDDEPVALGGVTWDGTTHTAALTIAGGEPLPDGAYRLLVCGSTSLYDLGGNSLDGNGDGTGGDDFLLDFRVDAANAFANGRLDCGLGSWIVASTHPDEVSHGAADAAGSSISGSVHVTNLTASSQFSIGQCVPAAVGVPRELSARVRFAAAPGVTVSLSGFCESFAQAACNGASLGVAQEAVPLSDTLGQWLDFESDATAPAGSVSAMCGYSLTAAGASFDADLDDLVLRDACQGDDSDGDGVADECDVCPGIDDQAGVDPCGVCGGDASTCSIFEDGFESGDLSAWSGAISE